jgi:hypothetical protein
MAQYEVDSPPALALQQQIDRTQSDLINIAVQNYYVEQMVYHI